jgi:hypothetical protein
MLSLLPGFHLYFPSLTFKKFHEWNFNKLPVLAWILPAGYRDFGNLLIRDCTTAINNPSTWEAKAGGKEIF